MKICTSREEMLAVSTGWAADGQTVCLVPTMGNLHDGHLSLLDIAARHGERVITSIYVNPLQFAPHEDFNSYPRTVQADLDKLAATGKCDAVFMPQTMYGHGHATSITPGGAAEGLESVSRPHFFVGVATVVYQLFMQTAAQKAIFGEKDFQQLRVIQQMVRDLHMGIEVIPAPTVREADGLAMSSRNSYLDNQQRAAAPALYQALQEASEALRGGDVAGVDKVLADAKAAVLAAGFTKVEYMALCDADRLTPVTRAQKSGADEERADKKGAAGCEEMVLLAAARIGDIRLIDNVRV
ncbi:MAG: pantoate--beta-alanine ligase [Candidatus Puniceispirillaceae bacterium]